MTDITLRRINVDIKSVTENRSKESWDEQHTYYYEPNNTNIKLGHFMLLGCENSPYFSGFYFFDHTFPDNYPFSPPIWKFLSNDGRTRFNPNLYQINGNGKVCLSILSTWGESSWSQVQRLSSVVETIRAHLFHDKPLTNEPGYSDTDPMNEIYSRIICYQNLNFNVYNNIVQTPKYAEPFKKIMKDNFIKNKDYFRKYIDNNKIFNGKTEFIRYDSQSVTYNFDELEKKYDEILSICMI